MRGGGGRISCQLVDLLGHRRAARGFRSRSSTDLGDGTCNPYSHFSRTSLHIWSTSGSFGFGKSYVGCGVEKNWQASLIGFRRAFVAAVGAHEDVLRKAGSNAVCLSRFTRNVTSAAVGPGLSGTRKVGASALQDVWKVIRESRSLAESAQHYGKCYFDLSKARLSSFVVLSAAVGYWMGSGEAVDWAGLGWTSAGTMLCAASANSFNQLIEVANDARMKRTMRRPLPAGRMGVVHGLTFAVIAGVAGVTVLASKTNALTAELGAANILLYALVYTPLKQLHHINTWVGAVVGAIPPLMGWSAATGRIEPGGWVLAAGLYFWQLPHFMALAYSCRHDYAAGGYKMLSLLDSSGRKTAACAFRNCLYLLPLGFIAQNLGVTSGFFAWENLLLTSGIGATAALFYLRPSPQSARRLFRISLIYLPFFMSAMVFHRIPRSSLSTKIEESAPTLDFYNDTRERKQRQTLQSEYKMKNVHLPPIAFMSYAPFPFLPAPDY